MSLSRFLAALDQPTVEALRTLFQKDLLARKPFPTPGGLFDRTGVQWVVVDVDGTRQAARQRALPQADAFPSVPNEHCTQQTRFRRLRFDTYRHYPLYARAIREWRERPAE